MSERFVVTTYHGRRVKRVSVAPSRVEAVMQLEARHPDRPFAVASRDRIKGLLEGVGLIDGSLPVFSTDITHLATIDLVTD